MTTPETARAVHLAARPEGEPGPENFRVVEEPVASPAPGEILVRNRYMSVDPYMRGRMRDAKSYVPPFELNRPMEGAALGEVVASRSEAVAEGSLVQHNLGWREYATLPAEQAQVLDPDRVPSVTDYLGVAGGTGFTAWTGLFEIANMAAGETVFVSGAAGAVGSAAGQMAKLKGAARVVGSAGSKAKVDYVRDELGFDAAFDYHDGPVADRLAESAPEGVDVYFDNVGGEHLEAALHNMRNHGRIALCGMISQYNATEPAPGPRDMFQAIARRVRMQGFIVSDHGDRMPAFLDDIGTWLNESAIRADETFADGIENAPDAFLGMMRGHNTGKMIVRL
ncbi:NADP-dependent oxidoreductase [Streptomonospora litoralis]|uniref:NADP-dependent oxidoreductase YfmJ n=1 Tax=Streptomonospora litoralis TaxID=2498135 RepID=A0A4P6PVR4_9ACTN|nr:NADP-dependent oxidoreductase [Streptomonospora litoralis]QBI52326.1 Putative NADP-dependent oxidoreductase YfmJ [Streptomonospora litoralis]